VSSPLFHAANPAALQYVVVAGGDRVVPFQRIVDEAGMSNETDYSRASSTPAKARLRFKTGYFLSQDLYGSFNRISVRDHDSMPSTFRLADWSKIHPKFWPLAPMPTPPRAG